MAVSEQGLGKNVPVEINSHVTIEGVFDMVCTEELS
jgi:hypothetical protein